MATVKHVENDDGTHSIGAVVDKQFVPFVTLDAYRVAQLVENAEQSSKAADDEDEKGGGK